MSDRLVLHPEPRAAELPRGALPRLPFWPSLRVEGLGTGFLYGLPSQGFSGALGFFGDFGRSAAEVEDSESRDQPGGPRWYGAPAATSCAAQRLGKPGTQVSLMSLQVLGSRLPLRPPQVGDGRVRTPELAGPRKKMQEEQEQEGDRNNRSKRNTTTGQPSRSGSSRHNGSSTSTKCEGYRLLILVTALVGRIGNI